MFSQINFTCCPIANRLNVLHGLEVFGNVSLAWTKNTLKNTMGRTLATLEAETAPGQEGTE